MNRGKYKSILSILLVVFLLSMLTVGCSGSSDKDTTKEVQQEEDTVALVKQKAEELKKEEAPEEVEPVEYEVVNQEEHGLATERTMTYWVVVDPTATDEQLEVVFNEIYPKDKKLKGATVFFYDKKSDIEAGNIYTVAKVERMGSSGKPTIER